MISRHLVLSFIISFIISSLSYGTEMEPDPLKHLQDRYRFVLRKWETKVKANEETLPGEIDALFARLDLVSQEDSSQLEQMQAYRDSIAEGKKQVQDYWQILEKVSEAAASDIANWKEAIDAVTGNIINIRNKINPIIDSIEAKRAEKSRNQSLGERAKVQISSNIKLAKSVDQQLGAVQDSVDALRVRDDWDKANAELARLRDELVILKAKVAKSDFSVEGEKLSEEATKIHEALSDLYYRWKAENDKKEHFLPILTEAQKILQEAKLGFEQSFSMATLSQFGYTEPDVKRLHEQMAFELAVLSDQFYSNAASQSDTCLGKLKQDLPALWEKMAARSKKQLTELTKKNKDFYEKLGKVLDVFKASVGLIDASIKAGANKYFSKGESLKQKWQEAVKKALLDIQSILYAITTDDNTKNSEKAFKEIAFYLEVTSSVFCGVLHMLDKAEDDFQIELVQFLDEVVQVSTSQSNLYRIQYKFNRLQLKERGVNTQLSDLEISKVAGELGEAIAEGQEKIQAFLELRKGLADNRYQEIFDHIKHKLLKSHLALIESVPQLTSFDDKQLVVPDLANRLISLSTLHRGWSENVLPFIEKIENLKKITFKEAASFATSLEFAYLERLSLYANSLLLSDYELGRILSFSEVVRIKSSDPTANALLFALNDGLKNEAERRSAQDAIHRIAPHITFASANRELPEVENFPRVIATLVESSDQDLSKLGRRYIVHTPPEVYLLHPSAEPLEPLISQVGLKRWGNICYLNSALQIFLRTPLIGTLNIRLKERSFESEVAAEAELEAFPKRVAIQTAIRNLALAISRKREDSKWAQADAVFIDDLHRKVMLAIAEMHFSKEIKKLRYEGCEEKTIDKYKIRWLSKGQQDPTELLHQTLFDALDVFATLGRGQVQVKHGHSPDREEPINTFTIPGNNENVFSSLQVTYFSSEKLANDVRRTRTIKVAPSLLFIQIMRYQTSGGFFTFKSEASYTPIRVKDFIICDVNDDRFLYRPTMALIHIPSSKSGASVEATQGHYLAISFNDTDDFTVYDDNSIHVLKRDELYRNVPIMTHIQCHCYFIVYNKQKLERDDRENEYDN